MILVAKEPYGQLSRFLDYPTEGYREGLQESLVLLEGRLPEASGHLVLFLKSVESLSISDLEELYTRTFDINPVCSLELGWILYGQQYERGAFLVRMRELLRKHDVQEAGELPDHLTYVLRSLDRMPEDEATSFVKKEVLPAVQKMREGFADNDNPYRAVLEAVETALVQFIHADDNDLQHPSEVGQ
ncbi:nitrate reductase molybdenum cofactor assembly chaperone [bacterium]|nr:nitrate reductase molybdenum cofactor assembly chaperone [bacterium]